LQLFYQFSIQN